MLKQDSNHEWNRHKGCQGKHAHENKKIETFGRKTETTKNYQMEMIKAKTTMYENLKVFGLD